MYSEQNEEVARRLGGLHSAKIVMISIDFARLEAQQTGNRWDEAAASAAPMGDTE